LPIAIVLRKRARANHFRDLMIGSLNSGAGDSALLCSGFFQENRGSSYQASMEPKFTKSLKKNNISLTTVGIHNYQWQRSYVSFRDNLLEKGVNITAYYKSGMKWHAKVFILSKKDKPIFGIIGSSNITRNAFSNSVPFNNECDVILWVNNAGKSISSLISGGEQGDNFPYETIRASYKKSQNSGLSIQDRLQKIKEDILNDKLKPLQ